MAFLKFNVADNALGNLDAGINASATTINLELGDGAVFPASNAILTFVQYNTPADPTSGVLKSEKVLMTSRSGDILTVTRGYDGSTATTFLAGDYVYLNVTSKIIEDIQDEVTRLETAKLNLGSLRTGLATAWRLLFTNGSNNETELAFGASTRVLTSNGATSAPTWEVPTVDINGLSAETAVANDDAIPFYDTSASGNKKILKSNILASLFTINGAYTTVGQDANTSPAGTYNSSSTGILSKSTISSFNYLSGVNTTVKVQKSTDNVNFSDVFSFANATGSFSFILGEGFSYRISLVHGATGSSSGSLIYTV